jgi:hypothetical protein
MEERTSTQATIEITDQSMSDAGAAPPSAPGGAFEHRSLLRYAPAFVLLAIAVADCVQYADPDLWGHVRFGQIMLSTGHLIRHDIFSYSAPGSLWIDHEWLTEVIMACCYNTLGVLGLKLFKFVCAGLIVLLLNAGLAETEAAQDIQFAILLIASFAVAGQVEFRPQLADYIFLAAILVLLARDLRGRRARLWLVLPIMVLWANLHGGFIVGVAVLGLYAGVIGAQELWDGKPPARGLRLGLLTAAALVVTLINPYGVGEWYIVLHNFQNPLTMHLNVEFQSLFWQLRHGGLTMKSIAPYVFPVGLMAVLAVSFAMTPRREDLALIAIAALMSAGALYAIRNMAMAAIACAAPAASHLDLALDRFWRAKHLKNREPRLHAAVSVQLAAFIGMIFLILEQGIFSARLPSYLKCPVGAVEFMQRHDLHGNVLCQYVWGVYVIWHEAPRSKVFFDSFELRYPQSVQNDYISFAFRGGAAARAMLKRYPHDYVLVETRYRTYRFMMRQAGWKLIYRDPVAALFARTDSPATRIAGVPILRDKAPQSFFP